MTGPSKPLLLIGMMGAGKTTLGRMLAEKLGVPFHDLDGEVEKAAGKGIAEIFKNDGEAAFRTLERQTLERLLGAGPAVIAAGGGVMPQEMAINIWIDGDIETLYRRSALGAARPKRGTLEDFIALYETRKKGYQGAQIRIGTGDLSENESIENIIKALKKV